MAIEGKVRTLYTDKTQQEAIFPTTKVSAVTDDEGNGLNTLLEHIAYVDPMDMESAAVLANADLLGGYPASDYAFAEDLKNLKPEDIGAAPAGYVSQHLGNLYETDIKNSLLAAWDNMSDGTIKVVTFESRGYEEGSLPNYYYWYATLYRYFAGNYAVKIVSQDGLLSATRSFTSGRTWTPWEWENSPMLAGKEYRTIEQFNGNPVYTMLVKDTFQNGGSTSFAVGHNNFIRASYSINNTNMPEPGGTSVIASADINISNGKCNVHYYCASDMVYSLSGKDCYIQIWYY